MSMCVIACMLWRMFIVKLTRINYRYCQNVRVKMAVKQNAIPSTKSNDITQHLAIQNPLHHSLAQIQLKTQEFNVQD